MISHSFCLICEANRQVLPWNKPADLCKRNQQFSQQATSKICPCELQWEIGQQVPHLRMFPTYFIRKQFSLLNFFFPVNFIIGHSCLYTPIYADTVLYINCCIKTCQMGRKYNMSKIIRLDWQMLILNMSVYIVYERFSWALILDSLEHLCFFYEI